MTPFTERAIEIIRSIPGGKVMTYGQIAELAGSPRGARQIVRILHAMSRSHSLPWHRVVNRHGEIALTRPGGGEEQEALLAGEGVRLSADGKIDLDIWGYSPVRLHP